jgi:hypothetical protein
MSINKIPSTMVNHGGDTVGSVIDSLKGGAPVSSPKPNSYSGNSVSMPIAQPGYSLTQQSWKTPVHVDMSRLEDPILPSVGPIFKFGNTGLTSGAFWSQDSYVLKGGTFDSGAPETVSFEPWTGHTATVEDIRILNSGDPNKWHINFKQQNWWPIIRGNTFADYTDKKGNFFKAIDDGGDAGLRYSGNSRVIFSQNRCKWLGNVIGGIGFYGSAVANKLRDNAFEGSSIGAILGAPSTFTSIEGLYNEMPYGSQTAVMLGDPTPAPNNTISLVGVRDLYVNMHGFASNRVINVGNSQVVVNDLSLDRIFVSGLPANPPPLVQLNDLPGQKVRVRAVDANDTPLIPLLVSNYVAVIDENNASIPSWNGDMVFADINNVTLNSNVMTAVARNWFAKSSLAGTFTRSNSGVNRRVLRQSRYLGVFGFSASSTNTIVYELPRVNTLEGEVVTVQWLMNSSQNLSHTATMRIYNPDGSRSTLRSKTVSSSSFWQEYTMTFYVDTFANAEDSLLALELTHSSPSSGNVFVTGVRFNRGGFGLSGRSDGYSYPETSSMAANYTCITP